MSPRQRIILNPGAGSVDAIAALERRLRALRESDVVRTEQPGDAAAAARAASEDGFDRVVAAGGDGTLHEVVQGLAQSFDRVQLGLLPLGTGNDFARSVGIPTDLEAALDVLEHGRERAVDVVRMDLEGASPRWIVNASSAGFSAVVSDKADGKKDGWGALAYSVGAIEAIGDLQVYRVRLQVDDGPVEEFDAWAYVLANGGSIAAGIPVAPDARVDDGRAELLLVPRMPLASLAVVVPKVLLGQHTADPTLTLRSGRRFRVQADPPMPINADGELVGATPVLYEVLPRRLRLIVPAP